MCFKLKWRLIKRYKPLPYFFIASNANRPSPRSLKVSPIMKSAFSSTAHSTCSLKCKTNLSISCSRRHFSIFTFQGNFLYFFAHNFLFCSMLAPHTCLFFNLLAYFSLLFIFLEYISVDLAHFLQICRLIMIFLWVIFSRIICPFYKTDQDMTRL